MAKLKHWRGVPGKNGLEGAPVLEFVVDVLPLIRQQVLARKHSFPGEGRGPISTFYIE